MENRNIYKMDDILIIASFLMLLPTAIFAWPWLSLIPRVEDFPAFLKSAPDILGNRLSTVLLYAVGVILSQLVGRVVRYKEKQSLKILDAMQYSRKNTVDQLAMTTGISAPRLRTLIRKLARIDSLGISLEGDTVRMKGKKNPYERSYVSPDSSAQEGRAIVRDAAPKASEAPRSENIPSVPAGGTGPEGVKKMPPQVEAIMKDKSIGLIEKIKRLQQYGKEHPEFTQEDFRALTGNHSADQLKSSLTGSASPGEKKKKFPFFLVIFLFMTPLWPVALIIVILTIVKQRKKMLNPEESVKNT